MIKNSFCLSLINCLLCLVLLSSVSCTEQKKGKAEQIPAQTVSVQRKPGLVKKEKDFSFLLEQLKQKNPFSKDHVDTEKYKFAFGALSLSGIFYDQKRPLAIINDQVFAVGDMVGDKQIIKITHNEVILKDKEKEYRLKAE